MTPALGIVIVNYNGRDYIGECLASIRASRHRPLVTVVVDNCSTDGSAGFIEREFPEVLLVRNGENAGFAGGVNVGLRHCTAKGCDAMILLNPDATVGAATLDAFVAAMARHPGALLTPAISHRDRPDISDSYAGELVWWRGRMYGPFAYRADGLPTEDTSVETASFCCVCIPSEVLRRVGPLDDGYFLYFEDADYILRARDAGVQLWYVPDARIQHRESSATGGPRSPLAMYYYMRNRHVFVRRFKGRRPVYVAFLLYSAGDTVIRAAWAALRHTPRLGMAIVRGAAHGWAGRTGRLEKT